jgi:hypothetical protein
LASKPGRAEERSPSASYNHSNPLFTLIDCPVIIAARSDARKAIQRVFDHDRVDVVSAPNDQIFFVP